MVRCAVLVPVSYFFGDVLTEVSTVTRAIAASIRSGFAVLIFAPSRRR